MKKHLKQRKLCRDGPLLWLMLLTCMTAGPPLISLPAGAQQAMQADAATMHMAGHMYMTASRPVKPGDQQKADAIAAAAKTAMEPYKDYRKALADGYVIFLPDLPQHQYHFTKYEYGIEARKHFDPLKPTSLLYRKAADGGYTLVGAMYTDAVAATEADLDQRVPLSMAHWHQHINFCKAPEGHKAEYFGPDAKYGCAAQSPPARHAKQQEANSTLTSSAGWCMSILMKPIRKECGPPTMTTRATTTWIAHRWQEWHPARRWTKGT